MDGAVHRMEKIVEDSMVPSFDPKSSSIQSFNTESQFKILNQSSDNKKLTTGAGSTVSDSLVPGVYKVLTVGQYQPYNEEYENNLKSLESNLNSDKKRYIKKIDKAKERLNNYEKNKEKRMKMMRETEKEMDMKKSKERKKAIHDILEGKKAKGKVKESMKKQVTQNTSTTQRINSDRVVERGVEREQEGREKDEDKDNRVGRVLKFNEDGEATGNQQTITLTFTLTSLSLYSLRTTAATPL